MLEKWMDMFPDPPDNKGQGLADHSGAIADWFERESMRMEGLNEADKAAVKIKQLEDQEVILDGLYTKASSPKEYAYILTQKALNSMVMWKEERFQKAEDAKAKGVKGSIYVHSKVIIIDEVFAMIGSNNINERSMYHDSENAVMIRATERENMPRELRRQLFNIMIGEGMNNFSEDFIFSKFQEIANNNATKLETGGLKGHVVTYVPDEVAFGSPALS